MGRTKIAIGVAVVLALSLGCAEQPLGTRQLRIVDGQTTTGSPATVFLWLGGGSCSGTLITPKVVLTARHCLQGVSLSSLEVFFGANAEGNGTWIKAVDFEYSQEGDIGILTMAEAGPTEPVPYYDGDLAQHLGETVHIVGFGVTSENGSDSGVKREGYTKLDHLQGDVMITGYDQSGSWTCYGDSGGPNYMTIDGKDYVVGCTSYGTTQCGQPEDGSVRTDYYKDWIAAYIAANDPADCGADGRCADGCPAPDPDCACASDGTCNPACPDWQTADVDCAGCAAGDTCRMDCPELDTDCCGADGTCNEDCGAADPDCDDPGGDGGDNGGDGGDGDGIGNPGDPPGLVGGCSTGKQGGADWAAALVLAALVMTRRRRR